MKPVATSFFLILLLFACRKDSENPVIKKVQTKLPSYPWRVKEHWIDENICRKYTYTSNNRLAQIKISKNEEDLETISYSYSGNNAMVKSNKNSYQYTYFLNSKGFADSCEVVFPGYVYIKRIFVYTLDNKLIRKQESGNNVSVPFERRIELFYNSLNLIREKIIEETGETIIDYDYDENLVNKLQGTEFLENFIPAQPKMQTKVIFSEEEENSYTYEIESDSIITRIDYYSNGSTISNKYYLESVK
jgi:hypothetical protein